MSTSSRREHLPRRDVARDELTPELAERSGAKVRSHVFHHFDVHVRVVNAQHAQPENLVHVQQMPQIRACESLAGEAFAAFLNRTPVALVEAGLDADRALAREGGSVARHAGRQHTVKHVDAARHQLDELRRRAEAHRITRLAGGQERRRRFHRHHHLRLRFAHADAADRVAIELHLDDRLRAFLAQLHVAAALHDAEHQLARRARLLATFRRPTNRPLHRSTNLARRRGVRRAIIEDHRNVRAEDTLNLHRFLRAEEEQRAIKVRTKLNAMRLDLPDLREAEHLEAAAVGEDGLLPVDEIMKPARFGNDFEPRPDVEVIGVPENDLGVHLVELTGIERLHAALGSHRHEHGRLDDAMRRGQTPQACGGTCVSRQQFKHEQRIEPRSHRAGKAKLSFCRTAFLLATRRRQS